MDVEHIIQNGGHCQPGMYDRSPALSSFEMRNYLALQALIKENDIACEWRDLSVVHGYMQQSMFDEAVTEYRTHLESSPEIAELVTVVTRDSKSPSLSDLRVSNAYGAIVQKHASSLWPYKLVSWILENLISQTKAAEKSSGSFNLQTNTPATHLQKTDNGWIVHTPRGMISAKKVLLATNAYTSYLLPGFTDLIVPVRGEMSSLIAPEKMEGLQYSYGFMGNGDQNGHRDDYLIQRPESNGKGGELMFGGGRSYATNAGLGVSDDSSIDPPAATYLRTEISKVLDLKNEGEELKATYEWSGIMGFSRDDRPWVGEIGEELGIGGGKGLWICAAYTGHGMPNAYLCAKGVIDLMLGKKEEEVDLPDAMRITKERVERALKSEEIHVVDCKGIPFGHEDN